MIPLPELLFHWRDNGPNLWVGGGVTLALLGLGFLACRTPKGRTAGMLLFGASTAYAIFVFVAFKGWPEEVFVAADGIHGRHDLTAFAVSASDIRAIRTSHGGKGGPALHVFLKSTNKGLGLPIIWDPRKDAYQRALTRLCPDAKLDW